MLPQVPQEPPGPRAFQAVRLQQELAAPSLLLKPTVSQHLRRCMRLRAGHVSSLVQGWRRISIASCRQLLQRWHCEIALERADGTITHRDVACARMEAVEFSLVLG